MRRATAWLAAVLMLLMPLTAVAEEGQRAPDYLMEGYDEATHDWETNRFFQRMQERTDIAFEFREYTDAEAWAGRKKAIASGEDLPDVLFKAQLTAAETRDMVAAGILMDLKPYLAEYAPDLWQLLQAHPDYLEAITLPDGSIPVLPSISELPNNDLMWINTAWLKNLHLEMPSTADELTEVLRAFRNGDPNRNGKADEVPLTFIGMWELRFLGHAFGLYDNDYYLHAEDGVVSSGLKTDENRQFLTWLHQLWEEKLLDRQGFSTMDTLRQITDANAAIPYGLILSNSPVTVVPSGAMSQYGVLPPLNWGGKQIYRDLLGPVTRGTFALTKNCQKPERLIAWVNFLYTHEGSLLAQVGQEGDEYFLNEDGTWDWMADLETVANDVLPNSTLADGGVAPGVIELAFQQKYTDTTTTGMIAEMLKSREFTRMPMPLVFLSAEDEKRIAELQSRIAPWAEQQMAAFVTGDTPITDESWTAFTAGLESRGLDEMIGIWQKYVH
ncbi:MAG: extracellular solute-binding protein [Clostridia bacterium]|nr:extracellular solute-binding protein [Clostridia bacterium]